jgi:hypothetical protein
MRSCGCLYDRLWPNGFSSGCRKLNLADRAIATNGRFLAPLRIHSDGNFLSLKHQENRVANDRFQGTADVARRPRKVTKSPKRSLKDS